MSGLNDFLEKLNTQGEQDSTGVFTVALEKAESKLEKFRLVDPNLFVLNLVSVAVLGGATYFWVDFGKGVNRFRFDGRRFGTDELKGMFLSEDPALSELAVALTGARGLKPVGLSFHSGAKLIWNEEGQEFLEGANKENTLEFQQFSETSRLGAFFVKSPRPAWVEVLSSCALAPLDLRVNGHRSGETSIVATRRAMYLRSDQKSLAVKTLDSGHLLHQGQATGAYSAVLGFSPMEHADEITLVVRGVSFTRQLKEFDLGGLGGVITVNHLQKNLSHSDLVEDQAFKELREVIWQDILRETPHFCGRSVWPDRIDGWAKIALSSSETLRARGERESAWQLQAWACAHLELPDFQTLNQELHDEEKLPFLQRYLDLFWHRFKGCYSLKTQAESALRHLRLGRELKEFFEFLSDEAREQWLERVLPQFPQIGSWDVLELILGCLDREDAWRKLESRLDAIQKVSGWGEREALLQAQASLSKRFGTSFVETVRHWMDSGLLIAGDELKTWLTRRGYKELLAHLERRLDAMKARQVMNMAGELFTRFVNQGAGRLEEVRSRLKHAHTKALSFDSQEIASMAAFRLKILGESELKVRLGDNPWSLCRQGCLAVMEGEWPQAAALYDQASGALESDPFGWSFVLRADLALAQGQPEAALGLYRDGLTELCDDLYQREGMAEATRSRKEKTKQWQEAARCVPDELRRYLNLEEAARTAAPSSFPTWVGARVRASLAYHSLGPEEWELVREAQSSLNLDRFIELALRHPSLALAVVRRIRLTAPPQASRLLARFRLLQMLDTQNKSFEWKFSVRA